MEAAMKNQTRPQQQRGFWRLYSTPERGWLALIFLVFFFYAQALFTYPDFVYRDANTPNVVSLQLAFTVGNFKEILNKWGDISLFKETLWKIDFIFPVSYAGLLAFAYAWSRRNEKPARIDRFFFLAPMAAALCDWIENSIHLYLLRNVSDSAQAKSANFSGALVFAASAFASVKVGLLVLATAAIIILLVKALVKNFRRAPSLLPYVYLLRIPALTAVILVGLAYLSFFTGARSLLENLFDLKAFGIFFVSLVAFLTAWATMAILRLLLLYGPRRFNVPRCGVSKRFGWGYFARHGLLALPIAVGATLKSGAQLWSGDVGANAWKGYAIAILMVVLGLAASLAILWVAMLLQRFFTLPDDSQIDNPEQMYVDLLLPSPRPGQQLIDKAYSANSLPRLTKWHRVMQEKFFGKLGPGYLDRKHGGLHIGLLLSTSLFFTSLVVYVGIGIAIYLRLGEPSSLPALSYALLLVMLVSWGLSGLSFFFDRYRLPVLIPLAIVLTITAQFSQSDYYYQLLPLEKNETTKALTPTEAIRQNEQPDDQSSIIAVAASGGGIQAAAWTARVLTGLQEIHSEKFGRRIRLISSVSGGSVGVMYFVNAYQDGFIDKEKLPTILNRSMASSIDAVGWGLVYPDFMRLLCPVCQISILRDIDRGQALEEAWLRTEGQTEAGLGAATLSKWREDARRRRRPAVIFNTTITDTGERLLLATSEPTKGSQDKPGMKGKGFRSFFDLYPDKDIKVVTAARLSASFPYASPAARANIEGPQFHIVDGGYYDNYGISSLAQWLEEALAENLKVNRALILQIRAFPVGEEEKEPKNQPRTQRGWFYQAFAPVSTLLNVRTAGQSAHNQVELDLLRQVLRNRNIQVETVEFEFRDPDSPSSCNKAEKNYNPPLSWHLTSKQKKEIDNEWKRIINCSEMKKVEQFLTGAASGASTP
jgi:hypothetical protein